MRRIVIQEDVDLTDCASTGYIWSIGRGRDGEYRLYAGYHTRWSGSTTGAEWYLPLESATDVEEAAEDARPYMTCDPAGIPYGEYDDGWVQTKRGTHIL